MTLLRPLLVCLAAILLTSACGLSGSSADDAAPFDAVLIELFGTTDTDAYLAEAEQDAAKIVQSCMNDAGFEFAVPVPPETLEPIDPTNIDQARADGFGIIANYRYQIDNAELASDFTLDPNLAYLATLPRAEVDRFVTTLDGREAEPGRFKTDTGCNGIASDRAYLPWVLFNEALPNYGTLAEERDTHPDWAAARHEWRDCMAAQQFDFAEPEDIKTNVIVRMRDTVNQEYFGGQLPLVEVDGDYVLDPQVDALLEELAEFERGAAVANIECTEPLTERFDAANRQVQQEYVDRHREIIDLLVS